jgi:hypothetical protein
MSYHILDEVLQDHGPLTTWLSQPSLTSTWIPKADLPNVFRPLALNAEKLFDLSEATGYEFWTHNNTYPNWHYDKDEQAYVKGRLLFPICSMVYYAKVQSLNGGELYFQDGTRVLPKSNRQVLFSPGLYHRVSAYHGTRVTMLLNPWKVKPEAVKIDEELIKQLKELQGVPHERDKL